MPSRVSDVRRLVAHFTGPSAPSSLRAGNRAKRETRHSFIRSLRRFLAHGVSLSSCLSLVTASLTPSTRLGPSSLSSFHSLRSDGYGEGRDADVRGEQTQGYEAKRVRGMKGVSHSRYVHSTCLSSL